MLKCSDPKPTKAERNQIKEEQKVHLDRVLGERLAWHMRIQECRDSLDESVMAIYLDGMDQDKTWVPRVSFRETDKKTDPVLKVRYTLLPFVHFNSIYVK